MKRRGVSEKSRRETPQSLSRPNIERPLTTQPVKVRRLLPYGTINASSSVPTLGAYAFKLTDVPGYTEFTQAYDQYRLVGVCLKFLADRTTCALSGAAVNNPYIVTAVDYDDANAPSAVSDLEQYSTADIHMYYESFEVALKPRAALAAYGTGAFSSYASANPSQWIDCASSSVEYYGVKYAINTVSAANIGSWYVIAAVEYEFRFVR